MHPILADPWRLLLYLGAWVPMSGLLMVLLTVGGSLTWAEAAAMVLPLDLVYAFVCLASFYVCRALPLGSTSPLTIAVNQLGAAVLSSSLWPAAARRWASLLTESGAFPGLAARYATTQQIPLVGRAFLLFLLAAVLHYLLVAFEASRRAETQALQFQIHSRDAELRSLRAQIHPHFLFNSLNSINALVMSRPEEARRVCILLADFLRRSLTVGARDHVTLGEELALAQDLLAIEKVRFDDRLTYETEADEGARQCRIPPLLLQPLVENAVTHGVSQCLEGGTIRLWAERRAGRLRLAIENPRDPDTAARKGTGIGLENVRRRLEALYGREAELRVVAEPTSFRVELSLPADA
jgi:two-component system, LytTR family, sensor histidine kinase AlgZ